MSEQQITKDKFKSVFKKRLHDLYGRAERVFDNFGVHLSWDVTNVLLHASDQGKVSEKLEERSLTGDPNLYGAFKQMKMEAIWEPYLDESTAVTQRVLMASLCVPTIINGEYRGMVGLDITLDQFQNYRF